MSLAAGFSSLSSAQPSEGPQRRLSGHRSAAARAATSDNDQSHLAQVTVYTRVGCPYCTKAKALLRNRSIPFQVVDTTAEPERRGEAKRLAAGATTLPQVLVGKRHVGGYDDLTHLDGNGELEGILQEAEDAGIEPTPDELLAGAYLVPEKLRPQLLMRARQLAKVEARPGSQPSLRAFVKYCVTGKPSQGQEGNIALNAPSDQLEPLLPNAGIVDLAELLNKLMLRLLDDFADSDTADIDYVKMRKSEQWGIARALAQELAHPRLKQDLLSLGETQRKALFINLYNIMTFHGVLTYGRRGGLWNLYCFFIAPAVTYLVGGEPFTLDDIENGVLRRRPGYFDSEAQSLQRDVQMNEVDPRIHMALNCGAKGCPAVAVYSSDEAALDSELDSAVDGFLADEGNFRIEKVGGSGKVHIHLTELFKMYFMDWTREDAKPGKKEDVVQLLRWILPHLHAEHRQVLDEVLSESKPNFEVSWQSYDWRTNGPDLPLDDRIYRLTW